VPERERKGKVKIGSREMIVVIGFDFLRKGVVALV